MRRLIITVTFLLFTGCTADSGNIVVAFDTSGITGPMSPGDGLMTDDDGYAHLEWFPAFLVIRVTAEDMDEPVTVTWPEEIPDDLGEEVVLDFEVPAGDAREVSLVLLLVDGEGMTGTHVSPGPGRAPERVDISAGGTAEVTITPQLLPRGTVEATWRTAYSVVSVSWIDDRAGAVLPSTPAADGFTTTALSVGRTYWPRVELDGGEFRDISSQRVILESEGQTLPVELQLD